VIRGRLAPSASALAHGYYEGLFFRNNRCFSCQWFSVLRKLNLTPAWHSFGSQFYRVARCRQARILEICQEFLFWKPLAARNGFYGAEVGDPAFLSWSWLIRSAWNWRWTSRYHAADERAARGICSLNRPNGLRFAPGPGLMAQCISWVFDYQPASQPSQRLLCRRCPQHTRCASAD